MTVGELRKVLETFPDDMLVGVEDADGEVAEVQHANGISHHKTGEMFFFIRPNGGYLLFGSCIRD